MNRPFKALIHKTPDVVNDPRREPVNLQAALVIRKANWIQKPLPPQETIGQELERLRTEVDNLKHVTVAQAQQIKQLNQSLAYSKQRLKEATEQLEQIIAEGEKVCQLLDGDERQAKERYLRKCKTLIRLTNMDTNITYKVTPSTLKK